MRSCRLGRNLPSPSLLASGGCFLPGHAVVFGRGETGCPILCYNFFVVKILALFSGCMPPSMRIYIDRPRLCRCFGWMVGPSGRMFFGDPCPGP